MNGGGEAKAGRGGEHATLNIQLPTSKGCAVGRLAKRGADMAVNVAAAGLATQPRSLRGKQTALKAGRAFRAVRPGKLFQLAELDGEAGFLAICGAALEDVLLGRLVVGG